VGYRAATGPKPGDAGSREDARGAEKSAVKLSHRRTQVENAQGVSHANGASYAQARIAGS